ncbi:(2Fe-2S)-binding protein [Mameliella sp. CS4]|uniref:(2Fe-2S)-binding protein n=1 Tax=Mameliella sp. CS4 TaxID=2862329 RepID=UPI002106993C|nr:(2Fe-2S)-binding protein [Mameliella sp. CS4]
MTGRIVRLAETARPEVSFTFDGAMLTGLDGDTVLTAILQARPDLRPSEFGPERRAGFCLMGACQDCWIWQEQGPRLRACSTPIVAGMALLSEAPRHWPGTEAAP